MTKTKLVNLDIKLIGLVKDNAVLYDHNHQSYMDYNAREVVWQKIGDEMKRPASECKARWINIRDINRRIIRKSVRNPGGSVRMYKYFNDLSFMRPFYRDVMIHAKRKSELAEDEENSNRSDADEGDHTFVNKQNSDDSDDDKPIVKRKVAKKCPNISVIKSSNRHFEKLLEVDASNINDTNVPTELDPTDKVDSFLLSIGTTLKTFSPYHLNLAKSKIFAVVQEHELQQIVSKHGQSSSNANDMAIE